HRAPAWTQCGGYIVEKISIDSSCVQVADAACRRAGYRPERNSDGSPEDSDKTAERRSPQAANGKISFRLLPDSRSICVLPDHRFSVNRNASFPVELVEST